MTGPLSRERSDETKPIIPKKKKERFRSVFSDVRLRGLSSHRRIGSLTLAKGIEYLREEGRRRGVEVFGARRQAPGPGPGPGPLETDVQTLVLDRLGSFASGLLARPRPLSSMPCDRGRHLRAEWRSPVHPICFYPPRICGVSGSYFLRVITPFIYHRVLPLFFS